MFLETTAGLWASDPTFERKPKRILPAYHLLSLVEAISRTSRLPSVADNVAITDHAIGRFTVTRMMRVQ